MKRRYWMVFVMLVATIGVVAIFNATAQPFVWMLLWWTLCSFAAAVIQKGSRPRALLVNFAVVLLVLAGYEGYLLLRDTNSDPTRMQGDYTVDYFDADELLGYGPAKSRVASAQKYHGDTLIYSVRYTIDDHGLRVSPPTGTPSAGCVLFFGGSVTFGEGVEDNEAMPYQVGLLSGNRYRVYNFGFHGYGPHQMLAALESGRVDAIVDCRPTHVVYQAIIPHVERAAGLAAWDRQGPRYTSRQGGGATLAGRFDDAAVNPPWKTWLGRYLTYATLFGRRRAANDEEIRLYADIVDSARSFVEQAFEGAEFHVLVWDNDGLPAHDRVMRALEPKNLRLHRISDVLPGYRENKARFELSVHDHHPNAAAHAAIAGYILREILGHRHDVEKPGGKK